jgi:hypothetical protein
MAIHLKVTLNQSESSTLAGTNNVGFQGIIIKLRPFVHLAGVKVLIESSHYIMSC